MTTKSKTMCNGCRDDFYNHRTNFDGSTECWHYKDAKVVKRMVIHINQMPPYKQKPETVLSCRTQERFVIVDPEKSLNAAGYWK